MGRRSVPRFRTSVHQTTSEDLCGSASELFREWSDTYIPSEIVSSIARKLSEQALQPQTVVAHLMR